MLRRPTLLLVSVLANLTLGSMLFWLQWAGNARTAASPSQPAAATSVAELVPANSVWLKINNRPNDAAYADSLRQLGFPERVVRALVRYRIREEYLPEIRRLMSESERRPYWQRDRYAEGLTEAGRARMRAILYEIENRTREVLGPAADTVLPGDYGEAELRRYGNLSPQKISALKAIKRDYSQLWDEIQEASGDILFPEDREKLAYLQREEQADIARLLTTEELDQYQRRSSSAAYKTRYKLQYLEDSTEAEFLKIYRLQQSLDQRYGTNYLSPAQEKAREAAKAELQSQIQDTLGPERYREFQLVNDSNYERTRDFAINSGLPVDLAKPIVILQRESIQRSESTRKDTSLTPEQQIAQLQSLAIEVREKLRTQLGDERFAAYQQSSAGKWLSKLTSSSTKADK